MKIILDETAYLGLKFQCDKIEINRELKTEVRIK